MIEFPPYDPYEHAVSTSDGIAEVDEQLKQLDKKNKAAEKLIKDTLIHLNIMYNIIGKYADRFNK